MQKFKVGDKARVLCEYRNGQIGVIHDGAGGEYNLLFDGELDGLFSCDELAPVEVKTLEGLFEANEEASVGGRSLADALWDCHGKCVRITVEVLD